MSDSIKKYEELYNNKLEEKMISKGFGEKDSHDEEHVMKVVCKHFDLELTDDWSNDWTAYMAPIHEMEEEMQHSSEPMTTASAEALGSTTGEQQ